MVGRFEDPRGEFFNRFVWTVETPDSCRWEQAYSGDGGKAWETNWIMEFSRRT